MKTPTLADDVRVAYPNGLEAVKVAVVGNQDEDMAAAMFEFLNEGQQAASANRRLAQSNAELNQRLEHATRPLVPRGGVLLIAFIMIMTMLGAGFIARPSYKTIQMAMQVAAEEALKSAPSATNLDVNAIVEALGENVEVKSKIGVFGDNLRAIKTDLASIKDGMPSVGVLGEGATALKCVYVQPQSIAAGLEDANWQVPAEKMIRAFGKGKVSLDGDVKLGLGIADDGSITIVKADEDDTKTAATKPEETAEKK